MGTPDNRTRVLHVLGSLRFGGVESWLMRLLRRIDDSKFETVLVVSELSGSEYEEEARRRGVKIIECPVGAGLVQYVRRLSAILSKARPFDVMHSHVHAFSSINLMIARFHGVPVRIAHSHTDRRGAESGAGLARKAYLAFAKALLPLSMTRGLAVTDAAARDLFGDDYLARANVIVQPCGIELEPFIDPVDRKTIRKAFGIPEDAIVVGHVGNFVPPKNHEFLIRLCATVLAKDIRWHLVMVGSGAGQPGCEQLARSLGLEARIRFLGARSDVPTILKGLTDVFVFPSRWEGLPVALIEAQAAGVPCVISDVIPAEAIAPGASVTSLSLEASSATWSDTVEAIGSQAREARQPDMSRFDIENSVATLQRLYSNSRRSADSAGGLTSMAREYLP